MDIYAEIKSFSFYENKGTFYINVKVIEKRLHQICHPSKSKFEEVEIGDTISLKTDREKLKNEGKISLEELTTLLLNRFLILNIDDWEAAKKSFTNSTSPKFILSKASKCAFLLEK